MKSPAELLALAFYTNWLRKPSTVFDLTGTKEFGEELTRSGCTVTRAKPDEDFKADAVTFVNASFSSTEDLDSLLSKARSTLHAGGVFFLRVKESEWPLWSILSVLDRAPRFVIAETYTLGKDRDYLFRAISKRPTLCIGMIAKNEERDLPRCLNSLDGVADGIVMLDTGSVDRTKGVASSWADEQRSKNPAFVSKVQDYFGASEKDQSGDWKLWDFGKARNEYVQIIETSGFDFCLWMDADDELKNKEISHLRYLDQYAAQGVMIESGGVRWPHHRFLRCKRGVRYSGWCHEYPGWGNQPSVVHENIVIRHDAAPGAHENSNDRNLRILKREMEHAPRPRTAFYLGNTYKDRGMYAEAIPAYQARLDFGRGFEDEYWFAVLYKARCERLANKLNDARKTLLLAVAERPDWSEFWMELAYLENAAGHPDRSTGYALQAKDRSIPPTTLWRETDKYTDQPYRIISWNYQQLGKNEDALDWAEKARVKIGGVDSDWENRIASLKQSRSARVVLWHRPGAIGDVLMTLNLVRLYKKKNPNDFVVYQTHPSTANHLESVMLQAGVDKVVTHEIPHNLKFNLVGYPLAEGYPDKPMQKHLLEYFSRELGLAGEIDSLKLPLPTPLRKDEYLTLHVKAGWSMYKEWNLNNWKWLCEELHSRKISVVQIGGPDDPKITPDSALGSPLVDSLALMSGAKLHLGIDSWTNHATNIEWDGRGKVPGVILWGSTQSSAAGYAHNVNLSAGLPCQPCFREDPKISATPRGICPFPAGQSYENPQHLCMRQISGQLVLKAVLDLLQKRVE